MSNRIKEEIQEFGMQITLENLLKEIDLISKSDDYLNKLYIDINDAYCSYKYRYEFEEDN